MGVWRAQHEGAQEPELREVVDVAAGAAQQVGILLARHRLPNPVFTHGHVPALVGWRSGPSNLLRRSADRGSSPRAPPFSLEAPARPPAVRRRPCGRVFGGRVNRGPPESYAPGGFVGTWLRRMTGQDKSVSRLAGLGADA